MRLKRIAVSALLIVLALTTAFFALGGTMSDPLLTVSYFTNTYLPGIAAKTTERFTAAGTAAFNGALTKGASIRDTKAADITTDRVAQAVASAVLNKMIVTGKVQVAGFRSVSFAAGETAKGTDGTSFYLVSGGMSVAGGRLIDLSSGSEIAAGSALKINTYYIFPESTTAELSVSSAAVLRVSGALTSLPPYIPAHTRRADALRQLGLFMGTNNGYELNRQATRLEGIIMLIRLMGEEEQALAHSGKHPFKDVPVWADKLADKYVGYAYDKGYTKGMSATQFGSTLPVTGVQYVTMVLRALGYNDDAGDFVWDKSFSKAIDVGLYTNTSATTAQTGMFRRDQVVEASCNALFVPLKNTDTRLIDSLSAKGVFTPDAMQAALEIIAQAG